MDRASNSPPNKTLIDAARHYAARVAGRAVVKMVMTLDDGMKLKIDFPRECPDQWPPAHGWGVRGSRGSLNGQTFALAGKALAVFRALVEAGDEGVAFSKLKLAVWDEHAETRTVENTVSKLRQTLRDTLESSASIRLWRKTSTTEWFRSESCVNRALAVRAVRWL